MKSKLAVTNRKLSPGNLVRGMICLLALGGLFVLAGCGQQTGAQPDYVVSGVISADSPAGPVKNAVVELMQNGSPAAPSVKTDKNGQYTFVGVPGGSYTITASLEGYKSGITGVFEVYGDVAGKDLTLEKLPDDPIIAPVYGIHGTITADDPEGPVDGALVQLKLDGTDIGDPVITGEDGVYTITGVLPGTGYTIEVSFTGYTTGMIPAFAVLSDVTGKDLVLEKIIIPTYEISGVITTDSPGGAAAGASVQLKQDGVNIGDPVTTGVGGTYTISGVLPGGNYTIEATLTGYTAGYIPAFEVLSDVTGKDLTLEKIIIPVYTVSGTISGDNPAGPLSGASVQLKQNGANVGSPVTTGPGGAYTIPNLLPGANFTIEVTLSGYTSGSIPAFDVLSDVTGKNLTLTRIVYTVSGTITTDSPGGAAAGASVQLKQNGANVGSPVTTGSGGTYTISGVPAGTGYTVTASLGSYNSVTSSAFNVSSNVSGINLTLTKITGSYSLTDLNVDTGVAARTVLSSGFGGYTGEVIKVAPKNGARWQDWDTPISYNLGSYNGYKKISIFMSVWLEKPISRMYSGPSEIIWLILNGKDNWDNFCDPPLVVPDDVPTGEWHELVFSQYINLVSSVTNKYIYLDGLNEEQGLVDLTLYFRHFKVTVEDVKPSDKLIALTFDDGPFLTTPDKARVQPDTITLLDKLKELELSTGENINVSFFVNGMRIDARDPSNDSGLTNPQRDARKADRQAVIRRMIAEGHEVTNHSYSHNYLGGVSPAAEGISTADIPNVSGYSVRTWPLTETQIRTEIQDCQDAIQEAVYGRVNYSIDPRVSNYFRTPFTASMQISLLKSVTAGMGLPIIYGPGCSGEYNENATSAIDIANNIYNMRVPYAVIICHDPKFSPNIVNAMDNVIPRLIADGYSLVTLSEMEALRGRNLTAGTVYSSLNPDLP